MGVRKIFREKPFSAQVVLDGTRTLDLDHVRYISIHVQPREGGGFRMAPRADGQDGQFDLCIVTSGSRLYLTKILISAFLGRHTRLKGVHMIRCTTAVFRTDQKVCVHTDGEICGHLNEFNVLCERRKLKMIL